MKNGYYKVVCFKHIRDNEPECIIELWDPQMARSKLRELGERFVPADLEAPDGHVICRNYPNVYLGSPAVREKQEALWNARDPSWANV